MPSFTYRVRESSGQAATGVLDAPSLQEAGRMLRAEGKIIIDLQNGGAAAQAQPAARMQKKRVKADDILLFTNQLSVMLETGVPLSEALEGIGQQTRHTGVAALVKDIADEVQAGSDLSTALKRHEKIFGELYISMVAASEASGTMGSMLGRLAEYLSSQREIRKQIRGAMAYPVCILSFSILIVTMMMIFVLPRFEGIYAGKQAILPLPTRILLGVGHVARHDWYLIVGGLCGLAVAGWYGLKTPTGKYWANRARLNVPILGGLYQKVYISRSLRTLATMLSSGVEMLNAIRITAAVAGNLLYRNMWMTMADHLSEGRTLSDELFATTLIPQSISQMIACGDKSGRLSDVMNRICDFCESDLRIGVKTLTAMMEPAMIIIMGVLVGGIAMALLLPIFSISSVIAK